MRIGLKNNRKIDIGCFLLLKTNIKSKCFIVNFQYLTKLTAIIFSRNFRFDE